MPQEARLSKEPGHDSIRESGNARCKRMMGLTRYRKLAKYWALRHLPGKRGRRYERKFLAIRAQREFENAVRLAGGMTCIDLGANIGEYTKMLAGQAKQVIAFEPDPWAHTQLRSNVAGLENVKIENAAAGTREGAVYLYRRNNFESNPSSNSKSSSVIANKTNVSLDGAIEVRQIDFIKYIESLDENIGIVKIDIEGAEIELLEALFKRPDLLLRIDHIFVETHESSIPGMDHRVNELRKRAEHMVRPRVNMDWH